MDNKKKRKILSNGIGMGYGEDDEGLEDDVEGQREVDELVLISRLSGDRLKRRKIPSKVGSGSGSGLGLGLSLGSAAGVLVFDPTWRSINYEIGMVGDHLTKALAARPIPVRQAKGAGSAMQQEGHGHGHGQGQGQGQMLPMSMATGGVGFTGPEMTSQGLYGVA